MRQRAWASHAGAFVAGALISAIIIAPAVPGARGDDRYAALDTFAQSLSYIAQNYVDVVDERALIHGAVRGMVDSLDTHSAFLPPERYRQLREDTEGEFGGVGVSLGEGPGEAPRYPVIERVMPGSPASRAGILPGDRVLAIDGQPTTRQTRPVRARHWDTRLRGLSGTRVKLQLQRPTWPAARDFVLVRERVKVPTVSSLQPEPGIGYLAVSRFQEATASDAAAALETLVRDGVRVLILDLRGNPGGLLDQAIRVADLFLREGTIVSIRGRRGTQIEREVARAAGTFTDLRLLVLIDQGSASATEIVASALQDHGRATILGMPSFGKGSVQTFLDLKDGSGLKLTTARYHTPRGRSLEGAGITPDLEVHTFAEELIVAGSPDDDTGAEDPDGPEWGDPASTGGMITEAVALRQRLTGDHQFEMAHQMARKWLGSEKTSGTR